MKEKPDANEDKKDFIEFKYPFLGGPLIEQATSGLCYGQEKSVISSTQLLEVQKEKCHPKRAWIKITLDDYNRLEPGFFWTILF